MPRQQRVVCGSRAERLAFVGHGLEDLGPAPRDLLAAGRRSPSRGTALY
jgi:hypothetical protein